MQYFPVLQEKRPQRWRLTGFFDRLFPPLSSCLTDLFHGSQLGLIVYFHQGMHRFITMLTASYDRMTFTDGFGFQTSRFNFDFWSIWLCSCQTRSWSYKDQQMIGFMPWLFQICLLRDGGVLLVILLLNSIIKFEIKSIWIYSSLPQHLHQKMYSKKGKIKVFFAKFDNFFS